MRDFFKALPIFVLLGAFMVFTGVCYIGNIVKLVQCDWKADGEWKGEIVHAIGLFPPASYVTYWFDDK